MLGLISFLFLTQLTDCRKTPCKRFAIQGINRQCPNTSIIILCNLDGRKRLDRADSAIDGGSYKVLKRTGEPCEYKTDVSSLISSNKLDELGTDHNL